MTVQSVPVRVGLGLRFQSCLLAVGSQQSVAVVLQQGLDVQVARFLQRTVQQVYVVEGELISIELFLCLGHRDEEQKDKKCY